MLYHNPHNRNENLTLHTYQSQVMPTLEFKGKQYIYSHHHSVPFRELLVDKKSMPASGKKPSLDDNLIIHGDNLHALKALMPQYAGKIKCIYIDPPYNTGNEGWCYNDNVNSPLMKEWISKNANPVDKEDMQRHDKWLCMMYPRLKLLHELLADDGVIFVSIDDNELNNLRGVMDEIFGEENFIGMFIINSSPSAIDYGHIAKTHDYALFYAKDILMTETHYLREEDKVFKYKDEIGSFNIYPLYNGNVAFNPKTRPNLFYPFYLNTDNKIEDDFYEIDIEKRDGWVEVYPVISRKDGVQRVWRWGKPKSIENLNKEIVGYKTEDGEYRIVQKSRLTGKVIRSLQLDKEISSRRGTSEVEEIFKSKSFSFPKPIELLKRFIAVSTDKNSIVLDSFAGSGTAAHAVLALNKEDGGNRKFILVEMEDYANSITAERVRRAIQGYAFTGIDKQELLNEKINFSQLKNANKLLKKVELIEFQQADTFDKISKTLKDGTLIVTGETNVTDKKAGLGGSFTFCELGNEISIEKIITGESLPDYGALAKYVFYTATGKSLDGHAKEKLDYFVGETDLYEVYLIYKPDIAFLRGNDSALNYIKLKAIAARNSKKEKLVFATAKYMGQKELSSQNITFCQLPYAIHKVVGA